MTKEQLGRDAFTARVDEWYLEVGETIVSQDRILGISLDWSRLRFTMDPRYVRAVMTAFVAFYERGWIYRGPRIVNWCPHDLSAISDLEVDWQEHQDTLYYIRYPIEGGGEVVIATVRPETMLADTGVAVNPTDDRYRGVDRKDRDPAAGRAEAAHRRRRRGRRRISAPARSRSRRVTTRWTTRSASAIRWRSSTACTPTRG